MDTTTLVPVEVPCRCPIPEPHEFDTVYLRPRLGLAGGVAVQRAVNDFLLTNERRREDVALGSLVENYLIWGVAAWTLVDEHNKPLEVKPDTLQEQLIDDFERAKAVADKADELYKEPVLGPLVRRTSSSSRTTSSNGRTLVTQGDTPKRRRRSKPSSTSTSPTAGTETTTG